MSPTAGGWSKCTPRWIGFWRKSSSRPWMPSTRRFSGSSWARRLTRAATRLATLWNGLKTSATRRSIASAGESSNSRQAIGTLHRGKRLRRLPGSDERPSLRLFGDVTNDVWLATGHGRILRVHGQRTPPDRRRAALFGGYPAGDRPADEVVSAHSPICPRPQFTSTAAISWPVLSPGRRRGGSGRLRGGRRGPRWRRAGCRR